MKTFIILSVAFLSASLTMSQNRLVLNNNAFLTIRNGAKLVLENDSSNAITIAGSGGNIVSEGENNMVKWNIGASTGTYILPFSTLDGNKIPMSLDISTSGTANGSILFSTYAGANWDNSTYLPSDVTSISSACCLNSSANIIDRFWIVDPVNYTTKPTVSMVFTYSDTEHTANLNTINESSLVAIRFNSTLNSLWDWYGDIGTVNTSANTVSTGLISSSNFFRSWSLANRVSALPIELLYFKLSCIDSESSLFEWATATEINNDFFTIERSADALNWLPLVQVPRKGNSLTSTSMLTYSYTDKERDVSNSPATYYRLKQTDFDGKYSYSSVIINTCTSYLFKAVNVFVNSDNGLLMVNLYGYQQLSWPVMMTVSDMLGRIIETRSVNILEQKRQETFSLIGHPPGVYYITINSRDKAVVKKIVYQ